MDAEKKYTERDMLHATILAKREGLARGKIYGESGMEYTGSLDAIPATMQWAAHMCPPPTITRARVVTVQKSYSHIIEYRMNGTQLQMRYTYTGSRIWENSDHTPETIAALYDLVNHPTETVEDDGACE